MADDIDPARIATDAVIHPGCRISGSETSVGPGCIIGAEAPVVLENCQLGRNVELKGGFFSNAAFFEGAHVGSGAHVRSGTILEEGSNAAHTVGLKQTLLMPFVTLGSLINFCDVLIAGGTGAESFSEVGSSYVHFNFTPRKDKATASLLGDVANGVFLDRKPIFLGGQGGLAGPVRLAYGTVVAAGGVCREDIEEEGQLHVPSAPEATTRPYDTTTYRLIDRIVRNNLLYIGNIAALREWYRNVRQTFMCRDAFDKACCAGGLRNLDLILAERVRQLGDLVGRLDPSIRNLERNPEANEALVASQQLFRNSWPSMEFELVQSDWKTDEAAKTLFLSSLETIPTGGAYVTTIQQLDPETREAGRKWLQSIINDVARLWSPA